jgi:3-methyladenine DNA glycosylase Tag
VDQCSDLIAGEPDEVAALTSHSPLNHATSGGSRQATTDLHVSLPKSRRPAPSQALAKELRAQGYRFIGPTIAYAFMQTIGIVNDHISGCFRAAER